MPSAAAASSSRTEVADVIVLAAGRGTRLATVNGDSAKWLTTVGETDLAARQIDGIAALAETRPIQLVVVTGHDADRVCERVRHVTIPVSCVYNDRFADLNNWYTVLIALRERRTAGRTGPVAIVNSDVWADPTWFTAAVDAVLGGPEASIVVDRQRPLTDEAMKVGVDGTGHLCAIDKVGVADPVGEYVGVLGVSAAGEPTFVRALESFIDDASRANAWYEHAVGVSVGLGLRWQVVDAPGARWVEIDDAADHATAESLAQRAPA